MPVRVVVLAVICLTLAAPASAQRMCPTVKSPVRADTGQKLVVKHQPTPTSPNAVCLRKDTVPVVVPVPPVDTVKRDTVTPPVVTLPGTSLPWLTELGPTLPMPNGWRIAYNVSSVTATVDPTGLPSLAMRFPAGYAGGSSPATVYRESFSVSKIRWEATMSYPLGYVKHSSAVDKSVFVQVDGQNKMYTMMYDQTRLVPAIGLQGIVNLGVSVNLTPNVVTSAELVRGRRHNLTCEATGNTSGQANGTVECWLDGVKFLSRSGIQFSAGDAKFTGIAWAPIWGGAGGSLKEPQSVYVAAIRVSGK